jgi:hypothetical protein
VDKFSRLVLSRATTGFRRQTYSLVKRDGSGSVSSVGRSIGRFSSCRDEILGVATEPPTVLRCVCAALTAVSVR